ncbi:MAG: methyltransferase domain-containing protein [Candidatus Zixiibacteriota bacterium]
MTQDKEKIDWSDQCWKEMLVYQRRLLWLDDTLDKLAAWLGLKPGMTALDVGCGLGYLGYTYWPYFGKGGRYFGVDISPELVKDAQKASQEWARGGEASFKVGDAYKLPFPDDFADLVMCQILLMHLERPQDALAEMIRVAKPGGIVMCKEPDNVSTMLTIRYPSLPELEIDELLLIAKITLTYNKGRIKLGLGDWSIGRKVPRMMKGLGLTDIGVRTNDRAYYIEPPYEGMLQQYHLDHVKKQWLNQKRRKTWLGRMKAGFLAGGGEPGDFDRYEELDERIMSAMRRQVEEGEFHQCVSGDIYIIKGRKSA